MNTLIGLLTVWSRARDMREHPRNLVRRLTGAIDDQGCEALQELIAGAAAIRLHAPTGMSWIGT